MTDNVSAEEQASALAAAANARASAAAASGSSALSLGTGLNPEVSAYMESYESRLQQLSAKQDVLVRANIEAASTNEALNAEMSLSAVAMQSLRSEMMVIDSFSGQSFVDPAVVHRKKVLLDVLKSVDVALNLVNPATVIGLHPNLRVAKEKLELASRVSRVAIGALEIVEKGAGGNWGLYHAYVDQITQHARQQPIEDKFVRFDWGHVDTKILTHVKDFVSTTRGHLSPGASSSRGGYKEHFQRGSNRWPSSNRGGYLQGGIHKGGRGVPPPPPRN
jgi:hypothetical protein